MLLVGLGEAGKNIVSLFKPHTKNYKIIVLDENQGIDKKDSVEEYDEIDFKFKITKKVKFFFKNSSMSEEILILCL